MKNKNSPARVNIEKVISSTADHYVWGEVCDGWHLVRDADLSVIEESMPPGAQEVRHYHNRAQQFFYILIGEATMETDGETIRLRAGEGVRILPGTTHKILNESSAPVRFLVISQPPSHGDRVTE